MPKLAHQRYVCYEGKQVKICGIKFLHGSYFYYLVNATLAEWMDEAAVLANHSS